MAKKGFLLGMLLSVMAFSVMYAPKVYAQVVHGVGTLRLYNDSTSTINYIVIVDVETTGDWKKVLDTGVNIPPGGFQDFQLTGNMVYRVQVSTPTNIGGVVSEPFAIGNYVTNERSFNGIKVYPRGAK